MKLPNFGPSNPVCPALEFRFPGLVRTSVPSQEGEGAGGGGADLSTDGRLPPAEPLGGLRWLLKDLLPAAARAQRSATELIVAWLRVKSEVRVQGVGGPDNASTWASDTGFGHYLLRHGITRGIKKWARALLPKAPLPSSDAYSTRQQNVKHQTTRHLEGLAGLEREVAGELCHVRSQRAADCDTVAQHIAKLRHPKLAVQSEGSATHDCADHCRGARSLLGREPPSASTRAACPPSRVAQHVAIGMATERSVTTRPAQMTSRFSRSFARQSLARRSRSASSLLRQSLDCQSAALTPPLSATPWSHAVSQSAEHYLPPTKRGSIFFSSQLAAHLTFRLHGNTLPSLQSEIIPQLQLPTRVDGGLPAPPAATSRRSTRCSPSFSAARRARTRRATARSA